MNKESLWRTLFLILLTVNMTVLTIGITDYSGKFGLLNSGLLDEFDRALQSGNPYDAYRPMNQDAVNQLQALKPPFWKKAKHLEYTALAAELRSMEYQVQSQPAVSTDTWRASYGRMPNMKKADIDRTIQMMTDNFKKQQMAREQLIPRYKEKLDRFKSLGKSLS